jgi:tRNA-specific 2-thiouridylase
MPFYVLNFKDDFKNEVIKRFVDVYEEGGTPNPCIDCNRYIKFNSLLIKTHGLAFDYLVTGHYAQIEQSGSRLLLKKSVDVKKDQSYVLYTMTQEQLAATIFPLGGMTKDEVRSLARKNNFINAAKHDSQDICFVPDGDYGAFMEAWTGKRYAPGDIIGLDGAVLGRHKGYVRYTKGQRRGLGVSSNEPLYVVAKSPQDNTVTLGPDAALYTQTLFAPDINLIACSQIDRPMRLAVKTRYLQHEQPATVEQIDVATIRVDFDAPQRAVTAGQAAVLYDGDVVVGGGVIGA